MDFDAYAELGVALVSSQPDDRHPDDLLATTDGLRAFLAPWPWMAERAGDRDRVPLVALRGALRRVFDDAAAGRSADMVGALNDLLAEHRPRPSISGHDDTDWHLHIVPTDIPVAEEYAAGAVMGLTMAFLDLGPDRFGACADDRCGGVFLDTSRNRSRRYCSERCATRANVAALRSRRRAALARPEASKPAPA
ncbi:MAG TPA: CGNR zinc finger domain-containing protein [Acidimicrobiales bacterium]